VVFGIIWSNKKMNVFLRDGRAVLGSFLVVAVFALGGFMFFKFLFFAGAPFPASFVYGAGSTQTASSTVIVDNAAPTVTSVVLNANSEIILTANATTAVDVTAIISDNNGSVDITGGTSTILVYRSGVTSSSCLSAQDNLNCYLATVFTASSSCASNQVLTTTTLGIYYFAQPTDSTSTEFSAQNWKATVIFKDASNATGTGDSPGVELNSLTALNVTTSSINYGTLAADSTSAVNEVTTSTNAGNTSSTVSLSATATLTKGADSITTSSQHYATATFTYGGTEQALAEIATHVAGSIMTAPTSTNTVNRAIFWALNVPAGTPTGTFTGVNLFTSVYVTSTPL